MPSSLSKTHLILIPTYNTGARLEQTVRAALLAWRPVWVVADGQHDPACAPDFMQASLRQPAAAILGLPRFTGAAPWERLAGRRLANALARNMAPGAGIGDCLFSLRVYPLADLIRVMESTRWARGFDFDPEAVIRLAWRAVPLVNLPAECRHFTRAEGGISHYHYLRDNLLQSWMFTRLCGRMLAGLPRLILQRSRARSPLQSPS
jgi:hypothetical protein